MKHRVICVDFDNTIAETIDYPHIKGLIPGAKEVLTKYHDAGGQIILWTCRTNGHLDMAIRFLFTNDIPFDAVNEYLPWQIEEYHKQFPDVEANSRKICADLYIDDKNPGGINWDMISKLLEVD